MISSDGTINRNTQNNTSMEDLLDAQLQALLAGIDYEPDPNRYGLSVSESTEAYALLHLAHRLSEALVPVSPSDEYIQRLKNDLVGLPAPALLLRWRKLPTHYRLAARLGGLTLTAGVILLAIGRFVEWLHTGRRNQRAKADQGFTLETMS